LFGSLAHAPLVLFATWLFAGFGIFRPMLAEDPQLVEAVGPLVIIGGAESSDGRVLKQVVQMAGGADAHMVVLPVASQRQQAAVDYYHKTFRALGVQDVRSLIVNLRHDASNEVNIQVVEQATGLFFSGGDQARIVRLLQDTPLAEAILDRNRHGIVLAGTSAGAAMMSRRMVRSGASTSVPAPGMADVGPGMMLIRGVIIDQHFSQRGRRGRLLSALADRPQTLGMGIDENTAVIVEGTEFRVVGAAAVYVYDASAAKYFLHKTDEGGTLALAGVDMHVIPGGFRFHFEGRTPVITGDAEPYPIER
jgi:cyanophycinase